LFVSQGHFTEMPFRCWSYFCAGIFLCFLQNWYNQMNRRAWTMKRTALYYFTQNDKVIDWRHSEMYNAQRSTGLIKIRYDILWCNTRCCTLNIEMWQNHKIDERFYSFVNIELDCGKLTVSLFAEIVKFTQYSIWRNTATGRQNVIVCLGPYL